MFRRHLQTGIAHVGLALRDPEEFAVVWNEGRSDYRWPVWAALLTTAIAGTLTYGMTMGLLGGAGDIFFKAFICTLSAGIAWAIPLPALYILNSLSGSRLSASSTLLAALVTVSWGGLAMIASIPINWFFTATIPHAGFVLAVNLVVFTGVGVAMIDVFRRVMARLEPQHVTPVWWLLLVGAIGGELFFFFGLFEF
ncbi:hypothetical protein [Lacipirellula parvula]|uniref:Yip1 domain-containing protein n=1 Tax=Lacipirellula parvula TaxID=2650471 RepID=A0A5K7XQ89_9BACT|nr:hypothetical protein [Lacipirellula parvula]BBO35729.1 hypothetical protein PLANPX_5341 [Lacipirellula parvula]